MLHYKATNMELQYVKDELTQHRAQSNMHLSELIALRTELRNTKAEVRARLRLHVCMEDWYLIWAPGSLIGIRNEICLCYWFSTLVIL